MKLFMYSIYDSATCAYMRPFFIQTDAAAMREFTGIALNAETSVGMNPEDYSLFRIGVFDDNTLSKSTFETPECLATALEVVSKAQTITPGSLKETENATLSNGA
jgi:hypothetical protein